MGLSLVRHHRTCLLDCRHPTGKARDRLVKALDRAVTALARDARDAPEHSATIEWDGDFDIEGLIRALHWLGQAGASRDIEVAPGDRDIQADFDKKDLRTKFGWDGDGACKIRSCVVDNEKVKL